MIGFLRVLPDPYNIADVGFLKWQPKLSIPFDFFRSGYIALHETDVDELLDEAIGEGLVVEAVVRNHGLARDTRARLGEVVHVATNVHLLLQEDGAAPHVFEHLEVRGACVNATLRVDEDGDEVFECIRCVGHSVFRECEGVF